MSDKIFDLENDATPATWEEFRIAGMLGKVNDMLIEHGWSIVVDVEATGCSPDDIIGRREPVIGVRVVRSKDAARHKVLARLKDVAGAELQEHLCAHLARVMFNAYGEHAEWKSWDGRPMPKWSKDDWPDGTPDDERREINDAVRSHWIAAAAAALGKTLRRSVPTSDG